MSAKQVVNGPFDPGPRAPGARALKANQEAVALLQAIEQLNLPYAARFIRKKPPSADAIATLAFLYHEAASKAASAALARHAGGHEHPGSMRSEIRSLEVRHWEELLDGNGDSARKRKLLKRVGYYGKDPERAKKRLVDAIYKAWSSTRV